MEEDRSQPLAYLSGFGNEHATEAVPGALPQGQNNPQKCEFQLYAEQLSGTAFTAPRAMNLRTWLYRVRPSVDHFEYHASTGVAPQVVSSFAQLKCNPNQLRWSPLPEVSRASKQKQTRQTETNRASACALRIGRHDA